MVNSFTKSKKGFTIIEVVLVLAIAGLIFLMVFIALPALQRSQRDTQRKNDIDRLQSSLISYVSNNNKLPDVSKIPSNGLATADCSTMGLSASEITTAKNNGECYEYSKDTNVAAGTFPRFVKDYLISEGDTFLDPSGDAYKLINKGALTDAENSATDKGMGFNSFDDKIAIVTNASCSGVDGSPFIHYPSDGRRNFAVAMRLEAGGTYCVDN